jgi:hypothetical protein
MTTTPGQLVFGCHAQQPSFSHTGVCAIPQDQNCGYIGIVFCRVRTLACGSSTPPVDLLQNKRKRPVLGHTNPISISDSKNRAFEFRPLGVAAIEPQRKLFFCMETPAELRRQSRPADRHEARPI